MTRYIPIVDVDTDKINTRGKKEKSNETVSFVEIYVRYMADESFNDRLGRH
jgi:hypothetical protein